MKSGRTFTLSVRIAICACVVACVPAASAVLPNAEPVYFYVFARIDDHVNREMSEERLRRTLDLVERLRSKRRSDGLSCTILVSGAMAGALAEWNASDGLLDRLRSMKRDGAIEIGYFGANEPTYTSRPRPGYRNRLGPDDWWTVRSKAAQSILMDGRDPLTGRVIPGRAGGVKAVADVFGEPSYIGGFTWNVGGDSEFVPYIRKLSPHAILPGLPMPNPSLQIHGYGASVEGVAAAMSPAANTAPELFWQDGFVRLSETSAPSLVVAKGDAGPEALSKMLESLDRKRPHIVQVEIGRQDAHLRPQYLTAPIYPPLRVAYDHPDHPKLPEYAFRPREEIEAAYQKDEATLQWVRERFLPQNGGSSFVSGGSLGASVVPDDVSVSRAVLLQLTTDLLARWGTDTYPPYWVQSNGRYFSLAQVFLLLAEALGEWRRTGAIPESAPLGFVFGPRDLSDDPGPNIGTVTVAQVAEAAAGIAVELNDQSASPAPHNAVPSSVVVGGIRVNAAQFLRLMADAASNCVSGRELRVRLCNMFSPAGEMYPRTISRRDEGQVWTLRPAELKSRD